MHKNGGFGRDSAWKLTALPWMDLRGGFAAGKGHGREKKEQREGRKREAGTCVLASREKIKVGACAYR